MLITNPSLTNTELELIEFFLNFHDYEKEKIVTQISNSHIQRDISPYFHILRFEPNLDECNRINTVGSTVPSLQTNREDGTAPTCFWLHIHKGYVSVFEVFNADSSQLNYETICQGHVYLDM